MKTILAFFFCLVSLKTMAQTSEYIARSTEMYKKQYDGSWLKTVSNEDVMIPVSFTKNVIHVGAKNSTTFKVYYDTKQEFVEKDFVVMSFQALEVVSQRFCRIDIVNYNTSLFNVFSVTYEDVTPNLNLRYYIFKQ